MYTETSPLLNDKESNKRRRSSPPSCTATLLVSTFIPSLAGFLCGYDHTVFDTTLHLPNFQHHFFHGRLYNGSSPFNYLTFGFFSMAISGTLISGYVCDQAGRKRALIGALLVFVVGTLLDMGFSHSLTFLVGRCLSGLGIGMMMVASPCLIAELAPAELRGCLVGFFSLMVMAGKLSGYYMMLAMGPSISASMSSSSASTSFYDSWSYDWRTPVLVEACLGLLMIWGQWQLPESPRWDRQDRARYSIALLYEQPIDSPAVQQLWEQIGTYNRTTTSYMDLVRSKKPALIGATGLAIADWLTGHATLVKYYAPAIFYASGLQEKDHPLAAVGCTSSLALAAAAISLGWCVDHFERKRLLLFGCVAMMLYHLGLGGVFHWASVVDWQTGTLMLAAPSVAIACVYLFIVTYAFTWGSLVLVTLCEWFGTTERAKGLALMMALVLATQWIQGISTPWYFCMIGPSSIYFFFAVALMVAACFIYRWVPNTTTRSLEAISC